MPLPEIDPASLTAEQHRVWKTLMFEESFHRFAHEDAITKLKAFAATMSGSADAIGA
jgi:hypothetical protein